jgi:hypothetical protein
MWAGLSHRSDGFVQASLRHDWQFATDSYPVAQTPENQPAARRSGFGEAHHYDDEREPAARHAFKIEFQC